MEHDLAANDMHLCPTCRSAMLRVMEEWICQKPCGFRSHDDNPIAWAMLNTLIAMTNLTDQIASQCAVVLPKSSIIEDFRRYREL